MRSRNLSRDFNSEIAMNIYNCIGDALGLWDALKDPLWTHCGCIERFIGNVLHCEDFGEGLGDFGEVGEALGMLSGGIGEILGKCWGGIGEALGMLSEGIGEALGRRRAFNGNHF